MSGPCKELCAIFPFEPIYHANHGLYRKHRSASEELSAIYIVYFSLVHSIHTINCVNIRAVLFALDRSTKMRTVWVQQCYWNT